MRGHLKSLAAGLGIASSSDLWQGFALRRYRKKLRDHVDYRRWVETEASRWASEHWGHETVRDEFVLAHLTSQLYELSELLRRRIGMEGSVRVLDAGASDGFFLARLGISQGVGVNFLMACARKIKADGCMACVGDLEALPFADKSFDYVICCETLEHVLAPIHALNELSRVCRQRLLLTIPWLPKTRINARPKGWPEVEGHVFEFAEADFLKVLTHARVRLAHRESVQVFPEPRNPLLRWWLGVWMYPNFFPKLQYYELEPL